MAKPRKRKEVYLDTSILGHWLLYYDASPPRVAEAPAKVKRSLLLLNQIREGWFLCRFVTSDFAFVELHQVMLDNIIANKILKDAQSLVYFHELKGHYRLSKEEVRDMEAYLDNFYTLLDTLKVDAYVIQLDMHEAQHLIVRLNLSTPDAIHLAWATSSDPYDYFVTADRDFFDVQDMVKKPKIVKASALHTISVLRKKPRT